jgi:poly-gamma-glutamate synthesis protein (capsule biosynthesis protein)
MEGKTDTPYIDQLQKDIRTAKEKADLVLFYPHVGGQFNIKPGAFSEYVIEKALDAGVDAIIGAHSHIPQKLVMKNGDPVSYCLGNFNMNPKSYLAMPEILTNYGYALHFYVEDKKIQKVTFSMLKNCVMPDGQIASCPVDEMYEAIKNKKEKEKLEKDVLHLYGRITGRVLTEPLIRREYEAF